ncbi:Uncharacterised protein [Bordetella pertussis]|nr:Uncharacterised protein [Bordetella pertussis]CFM13668.1 Uncharacterised protein [Bordetella pertussis]CFM44762.1 Uncharacterised protein [Bordetella pertussis]CFM98510.1 Uncharacterised protein [Bordetella pertussis]CFN60146.1 Uncharacterised protein [Bordetella pertussis]
MSKPARVRRAARQAKYSTRSQLGRRQLTRTGRKGKARSLSYSRATTVTSCRRARIRINSTP